MSRPFHFASRQPRPATTVINSAPATAADQFRSIQNGESLELSLEDIQKMIAARRNSQWGVPKWLEFCEFFAARNVTVKVYNSLSTVSKYVSLKPQKGRKRITLKIRFSNHKPNRSRSADCDIVVGISHRGVITTEQAIAEACVRFREAGCKLPRSDEQIEAGVKYRREVLSKSNKG